MPCNKRICDTDKNRLHQFYMENRDYLELAESLKIQANSSRAIVRTMSKRQGIPPVRFVYRKVDDEIRDKPQKIVEEFPSMTLLDINRTLRHRKTNKPNVTPDCISKSLDGMLITTKKVYLHPMQRNSETNKIKLRDYALISLKCHRINCHIHR